MPGDLGADALSQTLRCCLIGKPKDDILHLLWQAMGAITSPAWT